MKPPPSLRSASEAPPSALVVEDEPEFRQLLCDFLREQGARPVEAENGVAALLHVRHAPPDLILLDVEMPILGGWETLARALLECALKFSAPDQVVHVSGAGHDASVRLRIDAAGHRLPPGVAPRFFEVFSLTEPLTPGWDLGLGPPVAAQLLQVLGGSWRWKTRSGGFGSSWSFPQRRCPQPSREGLRRRTRSPAPPRIRSGLPQ